MGQCTWPAQSRRATRWTRDLLLRRTSSRMSDASAGERCHLEYGRCVRGCRRMGETTGSGEAGPDHFCHFRCHNRFWWLAGTLGAHSTASPSPDRYSRSSRIRSTEAGTEIDTTGCPEEAGTFLRRLSSPSFSQRVSFCSQERKNLSVPDVVPDAEKEVMSTRTALTTTLDA